MCRITFNLRIHLHSVRDPKIHLQIVHHSTGVSFEGATARTIGVCLERFSHKKRFGRQLLS